MTWITSVGFTLFLPTKLFSLLLARSEADLFESLLAPDTPDMIVVGNKMGSRLEHKTQIWTIHILEKKKIIHK